MKPTAPRKPAVPPAVLEAMKKAEDAGGRAAIQADAAFDYIDVGAVRLNRPTVAHTWVYMLMAKQFPALLTDPVAVAYLLAHGQEDTRNKVLREVLDGTMREAAYKFVMDKGVEPAELFKAVEVLSEDIVGSKKKIADPTKAPPSGPSGGAA